MPNTINDAVISVVNTGRRMQISEMFMGLAACDSFGLTRVHACSIRQDQLPVGHDRLAAIKPDC